MSKGIQQNLPDTISLCRMLEPRQSHRRDFRVICLPSMVLSCGILECRNEAAPGSVGVRRELHVRSEARHLGRARDPAHRQLPGPVERELPREGPGVLLLPLSHLLLVPPD